MKKGITLISLVITIIIMIILATVAINLAVDSNGLFRRAGDTANIWNNSVEQEESTITNLLEIADQIGGNSSSGLTLGDVYTEMIGQSITYSAGDQSEWIVLGEDTDPEKAGNILITTKAPVENGFNLNGTAAAWLSYVDDLHAACSVYGGEIQGKTVEARSITMEDINQVTGFDKSEIEFETYTFGTTQDFANKKVNYLYPKTGETFTDSEGTTWTNWKQPEVDGETTFDFDAYYYNDSKYGYYKDGSEQTVTTTEHIDPVKADLIWGADNDLSYLVASRSSYVFSGIAGFGVALVGGGGAYSQSDPLCASYPGYVHEGGNYGAMSVRPAVSLPSSLLVEEVDGVYDLVY